MPDEALYESCKIKDLRFNKTSKQYRSTLTKKKLSAAGINHNVYIHS